jgi:leucyl aminopeptidase
MEILSYSGTVSNFEGDLIVLGRFESQDPSDAENKINEQVQGALEKKGAHLQFKGKAGQTLSLDTWGLKSTHVLVVGLGKENQWKTRTVRDAAARAAQGAKQVRAGRILIDFPAEVSSDWVSGFIMGTYVFDDFKAEDPNQPRWKADTLYIKGDVSTDLINRGTTLANAVNLARTLVNEPPNVCTPQRLSDVARSFGDFNGVSVKILGRTEIEEAQMGGVIAVSQGATCEPQFIHVHYVPKGNSKGALALIGKGLTFDSGGLSLKPPKSQEMMHIDMGGSAAVLGAMHALVRLQPNVEIHAIVGACENMPDGNSYRPSDILTMYSKKTVEVKNTDAEGRLVLADALHYAVGLKPDAMVNLATLTGACMVGLGNHYCGLFSDDDEWAHSLESAAKEAGEKVWRLPLDEGLADSLKSKRADISNLGGPYGGAITAALFLKNFKGDRRWAHLDIAGPTTADKTNGSVVAGATGFGVLTLITLAENFQK